MDLEIIILSEARQRQVSYAIAYMQNLKKNGTNELIYKTETDSQTSGMKFWVPGLGVGEDQTGSLGLTCKIHTAIFKIDNQQGPTVQHRECFSVFCNNLSGKRI